MLKTNKRLDWDDERIALLTRLWTEGLSASSIASRLGGVTRNAVIGKVHRLGLSTPAPAPKVKRPAKAADVARRRPPSQSRPVKGASPAQKPVARPTPAPKPRLVVFPKPEAAPAAARVTLLQLKDHMCRWPEGDPKTPDFRFCGARRAGDLPYCARHARLAARTSNH